VARGQLMPAFLDGSASMFTIETAGSELLFLRASFSLEIVNPRRVRILAVDDHPLMSEGLATVIRNQPDMIPVCQASSGREAIQLFDQYKPDITLMDLRLPDMSGIDAVVAIRSRFPEARFIILTTFAGDAEIQRALEAGARAYLLKTMSPQEMMDVIRVIRTTQAEVEESTTGL
jgi:DNA-binding NarL/FixJ family response regulator